MSDVTYVYKIRDRKTGLFRGPGLYGDFTKAGKTYSQLGHVKSILSNVLGREIRNRAIDKADAKCKWGTPGYWDEYHRVEEELWKDLSALEPDWEIVKIEVSPRTVETISLADFYKEGDNA